MAGGGPSFEEVAALTSLEENKDNIVSGEEGGTVRRTVGRTVGRIMDTRIQQLCYWCDKTKRYVVLDATTGIKTVNPEPLIPHTTTKF